jgi:putative ABC transport system ATP-binding protein
MPLGNTPLLTARGISRFEPGGNRHLLDRITLAIDAGERVGLVGPTGAGKTVLLRAMAMLDPVTAGQILWQDRAMRGNCVPRFRTRVSYVHQRPVLLEGTVEENLRLPFSLRQHRYRQFEPDRVAAWLDRLGRSPSFLAKHHRDLSGGEGQLVSLVRALELEPQVLLLDEPTSALDRPTATQAERLVADWLAERPDERAYVWVSHDTDQTRRMCDRFVYINDGQLSEE